MRTFFARFTNVAAFIALATLGAPALADAQITHTDGATTVTLSCDGPECPKPVGNLELRLGGLQELVLAQQTEITLLKGEQLQLRKEFNAHLATDVRSKEYQDIGVRGGLSFGQHYTALEVGARYQFVNAFYYVARGGGAAVQWPIHWRWLTFTPPGLGVVFYHSKRGAMSAPWLRRRFDLVVPVSLSVRPFSGAFEGVAIGAEVAWFIPWIGALQPEAKRIAKEQKQIAEDTELHVPPDSEILLDPSGSIKDVGKQLAGVVGERAEATVNGIVDVTEAAYREVFGHPRLMLYIEWRPK